MNMAPWDALKYFDIPKESTVPVVLGAVNPVVGANPMRVGLILGVPSGNTADVVFTTNGNVIGNGIGITVSKNIGYIQITHHDFGTLVTSAWYAGTANAGQQATAIEVILHDWPYENPDVAEELIGRLEDLIARLTAGVRPHVAG